MLQTIIHPTTENFNMQVTLPIHFVGKEVHVLFYTDEEVQQVTVSILPDRSEESEQLEDEPSADTGSEL